MVADAEKKQAALEHLNEQDGPAFEIKADPRVTPLGRILRKSSIDELPRLFNPKFQEGPGSILLIR
jgi:lipopolysaccharide/colanic/teichoic acid biosynthesis glycosyltransferase